MNNPYPDFICQVKCFKLCVYTFLRVYVDLYGTDLFKNTFLYKFGSKVDFKQARAKPEADATLYTVDDDR